MSEPTGAESVAAPTMLHTKSFKKYTSEYEPAVVAYVREWAAAHPEIRFHEDNSLVKITTSKAMVERLLGVLKERFSYIPPEERTPPKGESSDS